MEHSKLASVQSSIASFSDFERASQTPFSHNVLLIFDQLSQVYLPYQSLEFIQIIFCIIQALHTSFWGVDGQFWEESKLTDIFHYLAFFSSIYHKPDEHMILVSVLFSVVFITSILFIILLVHFNKTRRVIKPILYVINTYFVLFGSVVLHPLASLSGHLLKDVIDEHSGKDIAMLILSLIGFFLSEGLFYINQYFINRSIYIHKSLWCTFDSYFLLFIFMWDPLFLLFGHLFQFYPNWSFYILIIFHVFLIILSCLNYNWMPFIVDFGCPLSTSILVSIIFNDILRIFCEIYQFISTGIYILICYILFFIILVILFFVFRYFRKKIVLDLSYSNLMNPDDLQENMIEPRNEDKFIYMADLNLDKSYRKAVLYLSVGFMTGSDLFTDFTLPHFLIENYKESSSMVILLIKILSYFKSEENRFESLLKHFRTFRNISYFDQFLYLQAHKIKLFRQVTSTSFASTKLNELKLQSNELEIQVKNFWSLPYADLNLLEKLEQQQRHLRNLWDESIEDNWSSISFREGHIRFLIESCTDFLGAVQMTNIKDKIDILMKDREDLCFLSLMLCFPQYISHSKVAQKESFVLRKSNKSHSTTATSSSNQNESRISTSSTEYDFTYEEQIANSILTYGKLRLAIQNALKNVKPTSSKVMIFYSLFSIIGSLIMIIGTFSFFVNSFDSYDDWNREVGSLVDLRIAYDKSFLCLSILFGQATNRFKLDHIDCNIIDEYNRYFLDHSMSFDQLALYYAEEAKEKFSELMAAILDLSLRRVDISTLTSLFFDQNINTTICFYGEVINYINWSMEQVINFDILTFTILAEDPKEDIVNWYYNSTFWCHNIATSPSVENMFTIIQMELSYDISNSSEQTSKRIILIMSIVGPCHFFIFVLPLPIVLFFYSREIKSLIEMMLATDQEAKEQSRKSISLALCNENNDVIPSVPKRSLNCKLIILGIFLTISFCAFLLFEEMIFYYTKTMSTRLSNFGFWSGNFSLLRAYLIEILNELINAIYYVDYPQDEITNATFKARIYKILKEFEGIVYEVMNDTPDNPSAAGKDDYIDILLTASLCETGDSFTDIHGIYKCSSVNQLMATIHAMIEKATEEVELQNGTFDGEELTNIYHIIFAHTISSFLAVGNRFSSLQDEEIRGYKIDIFVFLICGIFFVLIWSSLVIYIISEFRRIFNMALCLIRRLTPVGLINNSELTNYLLYKKNEEIEMGVTHTIFNNSFDGIICINQDGIVEIINKSFINDYGYSTEQLVGQLVGTIFDDKSREQLENQLKLMKNHESPGYTGDVVCFANDGRAIPSYITLFAIKENENSFILVVRDQTILLQKQKRLELAKKQSQDLLEQIMPPKVLAMLKEGKSEISFAVPSASVIFVDIVNFSAFSRDLSPQQTMGTLSTLFGAFDVWIQKFPLMTKIKLIGDTYMAACGLFAVDDEPKNHAVQCINFALRVFSILDDTNIKLNMNLMIRIGVNSDGPIIAGVLGTENRVFDIIGDTINVASRLEHKAEPGHVMMSEKTYELVKDAGFHIVPKGEMFLKGKGNMPAYSI